MYFPIHSRGLESGSGRADGEPLWGSSDRDRFPSRELQQIADAGARRAGARTPPAVLTPLRFFNLFIIVDQAMSYDQ
jgi:hypothetical protein